MTLFDFAIARRMMMYDHVTDIHWSLLNVSIVMTVFLLAYFIYLHLRIDSAWRKVKIEFSQRQMLMTQHWCLFAIRFSLLWLSFNLLINLTLLLNPIPPFIGDSTLLSDQLWNRVLENRNLMPYYKFVDLLGHVEDFFAYCVLWGSGHVCGNMITALTRGRKTDKKEENKDGNIGDNTGT